MARKRIGHGNAGEAAYDDSGQLAHWRRIEMRRELAELGDNLREVWDDESDPEATLDLLGDHPARFYTDFDDESELAPENEPGMEVEPDQELD